MKLKLILSLTLVIASLASIVLVQQARIKRIKKDRDVQYVNLQSQLDGNNKVLLLTKRELKEQIKKNSSLDSLLKADGIKEKDIEYITQVKHIYSVDTVKVEIEQKDTLQRKYYAYYDDGCLSQTCVFDLDSMDAKYLDVTYVLNLTHVGYQKKKKTGRKILGIFNIKKKFFELHTTSDCGINEVEQLKLIKK